MCGLKVAKYMVGPLGHPSTCLAFGYTTLFFALWQKDLFSTQFITHAYLPGFVMYSDQIIQQRRTLDTEDYHSLM